MNGSLHPLVGVYVKVARANEHANALNAEMVSWSEGGNPYHVIREEDAQASQEIYRVRITKPIPVRWGAIIGDIVHNLRSALDLLACQLVLANGATSTNGVYFPISQTKNGFETNGIRKMAGASSTAIRILRGLKPYKGGNDALWRLHALDIADKHRLLVPVGATHGSIILAPHLIKPDGSKVDWPDVSIRPANPQFPLENGTILFRAPLGSSSQTFPDGAQLDTEYKFAIHIAFGEGQIFDGEPVFPTLDQLGRFVGRVTDIFNRYCF